MKTLNTNIAKIRDKNNNWSSIPALKGESAYELAVKKGFEGSEDDFNNSLVKKEEIDKINKNINLLLNKSIKNEIIENASGSNIIIEDSSEQESLKECKIYGWSKQETTKGKNLFDFSKLVSDGINVMNYEKQTITVPAKTNNTGYNQTLRDLCPGITPGTYVFSMKRSNPESGAGSYFLEIMKDFPINTPIELTDELLDNHISWYNNENSEVENVISEIQIEIGTEATDYEPYTGGRPSPSPDYPQEIISVGSDGKIRIEVKGKNLLNFEEFLKTRGVIYTKESESYQITDIKYAYHNPYKFSDEDIEVVISGIVDDITSKGARVEALDSSKQLVASISAGKGSVKCKASYIRINHTEKGTYNMQKVQIERGVTATDYEPYHEPQSLSIQTPTGLPAIPVDSGGNYTDDNGQQWIADYIDLKRGKYVQRISTIPVMSTDKWDKIKQSAYIVVADALADTPCICSHFQNYTYINVYKNGMTNNINKAFVYTDTKHTASIDAWKAFLDKNDVSVSYILAEPVERDLTREEIQAYQNLVTYAGTTIVENDADCYMKLGYVADPKAYIDKKFSELSSAIIASSSEAE